MAVTLKPPHFKLQLEVVLDSELAAVIQPLYGPFHGCLGVWVGGHNRRAGCRQILLGDPTYVQREFCGPCVRAVGGVLQESGAAKNHASLRHLAFSLLTTFFATGHGIYSCRF